MDLHKLPKITQRSKKRLGRGYGSGKGGHTVGRGAKGDKARGKTVITFVGTKIKKSFIRRLPLSRGKGKFNPLNNKPAIINLKYLNLFDSSSIVDLEALIKQGLVDRTQAARYGVKILGEGKLEKKLTVKLPCSKPALEKIEKAGGKVVLNKEEKEIPAASLKKTVKTVSKAKRRKTVRQPKK